MMKLKNKLRINNVKVVNPENIQMFMLQKS